MWGPAKSLYLYDKFHGSICLAENTFPTTPVHIEEWIYRRIRHKWIHVPWEIHTTFTTIQIPYLEQHWTTDIKLSGNFVNYKDDLPSQMFVKISNVTPSEITTHQVRGSRLLRGLRISICGHSYKYHRCQNRSTVSCCWYSNWWWNNAMNDANIVYKRSTNWPVRQILKAIVVDNSISQGRYVQAVPSDLASAKSNQ